LKKEDLSRLTKGGLLIDEFPTSPCEIRIYHQTPRSTSLILTIHEGRKRQIRKMFSQLGYPVMDLMRIAVGTLKIGNFQEGKFRYLSKEEIAALWSDAKMDKGNAPT
jgi:pseudouridine synthase